MHLVLSCSTSGTLHCTRASPAKFRHLIPGTPCLQYREHYTLYEGKPCISDTADECQKVGGRAGRESGARAATRAAPPKLPQLHLAPPSFVLLCRGIAGELHGPWHSCPGLLNASGPRVARRSAPN